MLLVSLMLLTLWLGALVFGFTMGGFVHAPAIAAILIVLTRRTPQARHA
jgi:hypothetical protein